MTGLGFLFTALSYFSWVCWIKPGQWHFVPLRRGFLTRYDCRVSGRQQLVRSHDRPRNGSLDARLVASLVHRIAADGSVVGAGERDRRVCHFLLDRLSDPVLQQCEC